MSHEKSLQDGKQKKKASKSLKEKRAEKRAMQDGLESIRKTKFKKTKLEKV